MPEIQYWFVGLIVLFCACTENREEDTASQTIPNFAHINISTDSLVLKRNDTLTIIWGSGSGMCTGYCEKLIYVNPNYAERVLRDKGTHSRLPDKSEVFPLDPLAYAEIIKELSALNLDMIAKLTGCPDCNDGGYEYIEIRIKDKRYEFLYENGNPPDALVRFHEVMKRRIRSER
jgi:hypothetical protein